ncbi:MAG: ATP synthase subunit I [Pseudomonadales bacterium]|nr:ATP synthase subunit I [Pseudomonadales bacterium]
MSPPVYRIALVQLCATLGFSALGLGFCSVSIAWSILLGGLVSCLSNGLFIWVYFYRKSPQRTAPNILRTAYRAELIKVVSAVTMMVIGLTVFDKLDFLIFFVAFMVSQLVFWITSCYLGVNPK